MTAKSISSPVPDEWYPTLSVFMLAIGLVVTASFFIYEATSSRRNRSLAKELTTGAVASVFLSTKPFISKAQNQDHDQNYPTDHATTSFSCHMFFDEPHDRIYRQHHHQEDEGCVNHGGSNKAMKIDEDGLKLSLLRKNDQDWGESQPFKWTSSTRSMEDTILYSDHKSLKFSTSRTTKLEVHKRQSSSSLETDLSSNALSFNNNNNDNSPIRVCADCNTTKTPLWRSGPKGPKSLCNACGIRQRKARRAMAIAAAAAVATPLRKTETPAMKIKVNQKEKRGQKGHTRFNMAAGASNGQKKKLGFEEFLINLNKDLAFHRVFPQDEKEAAILLMALSSGLVHG
ncbi:putative GATA transcription factor 22 [Abeliophyllum distichum]|uniref:GATA transcription factor 22 n=1 Tax=Abeliophyllum distichum TaxID=126358 RepID=A0ABD1NVX1_9LAMI